MTILAIGAVLLFALMSVCCFLLAKINRGLLQELEDTAKEIMETIEVVKTYQETIEVYKEATLKQEEIARYYQEACLDYQDNANYYKQLYVQAIAKLQSTQDSVEGWN